VNHLLGKSIVIAVSIALAMSMLTDTIYATLGLSLLAIGVLVPIGCAFRLRRDLNQLVLSSLIWRLLVAGAITLWILPYYAARNSADATWYDSQAGNLAALIRAGAWSEVHVSPGADMVSFVTALLYLPCGPTPGGMTFVSALFGFIGALCFVAAAAVALPSSRLRGYAMLVLLLPSVVFWSSIFGKDSFVFFGLGICALGIASWLKFSQWTDFLKTLIGLGVVYMFRPHVALVVILSLVLTIVLCRERKSTHSGTKSVLVLMLLAPMMIFTWKVASDMMGVKELSGQSMVNRLSEEGHGTTAGGSTVATTEVEGQRGFLSQLPAGAVRLLFRPWPWEATSPFMFVAALDNLILMAVLVVKRRNVLDALRHLRTKPFAFFCVVLSIQLIAAFSTIPNLGLLVREKTQITPFLYILAFCGNTSLVLRRRPARWNQAGVPWHRRIPEMVPLDSKGVAAARI
jgi:hypothetical protein